LPVEDIFICQRHSRIPLAWVRLFCELSRKAAPSPNALADLSDLDIRVAQTPSEDLILKFLVSRNSIFLVDKGNRFIYSKGGKFVKTWLWKSPVGVTGYPKAQVAEWDREFPVLTDDGREPIMSAHAAAAQGDMSSEKGLMTFGLGDPCANQPI
jgi:hypothetical protein